MPDEHAYDGSPIGVVRVGSVELTQVAESGAEGVGTVVVDDVSGALAVVGQMDWAVTEADCANTHTYSGFVDDQEFGRKGGDATERGPGRVITVQLTDLNNYLSQTGITGSDGNKIDDNETVDHRLAWLVGSSYWPADVAVGSRVASSSLEMDKADYRQQQPGDVLADLAARTGFNHYVADWGSGPELTFRDDNTSTADSSDIRISNVMGDVDSSPEILGTNKTFYPSTEFKLNRSWREVWSKMSLSFAKGTRTKERTATEINGQRYGTASNSNIKTATLAEAELDRELHVHSTPTDFLNGSILVPSSAVNLLRQGERLQVKFSHLGNTGARDYDDWTWCRVAERTVKPITPKIYELRLRLSPQEEGPPAAACGADATPSATYWPLGGSGVAANPSDGVVYYMRPGLTDPAAFTAPQPGWLGAWGFGVMGAGGPSSIDYAGDCMVNSLMLMTVGNGTWTIQTESYGGTVRELEVGVFRGASGYSFHSTTNSGGNVTVVIDDTGTDDCIRVVMIRDLGSSGGCGSKWGWSGGIWTAA